ncbi:MAG TPA: hypothetical protein VEC09_00645 [Actinomycetota bacterium]|nr:hypothetical protein [Actinomycetota bacterium]
MHDEYPPPSSWHWNVTPGSVSVNEKLALVEVVGLNGEGVIDGVGGGVTSTVQVADATALSLPAASTAFTENVCEPSASDEYDLGLVHEPYAPPSSLHSNATPNSVSVNVKLALVDAAGSVGAAVIDGVGGGVVSTVHVNDVTALSASQESTTTTSKVCDPSARPMYQAGLVHGEYAAPSRRHWNVTPAWLTVKENDALVWSLAAAGEAVIDGAGGAVATRTSRPTSVACAPAVEPHVPPIAPLVHPTSALVSTPPASAALPSVTSVADACVGETFSAVAWLMPTMNAFWVLASALGVALTPTALPVAAVLTFVETYGDVTSTPPRTSTTPYAFVAVGFALCVTAIAPDPEHPVPTQVDIRRAESAEAMLAPGTAAQVHDSPDTSVTVGAVPEAFA